MGLVQSSAAMFMFMFMFMFMLLRFTLSSASEMSIISYDQNHGPSPLGAPVVCDNHVSCPESNTCCCISESANVCLQWGCCPLEDATCCDDRASCCPRDYPICDLDKGVCLRSKGNPLGVKAMRRTPAKPHWAVGAQAKKSSA